jgi:hypothetical protein
MRVSDVEKVLLDLCVLVAFIGGIFGAVLLCTQIFPTGVAAGTRVYEIEAPSVNDCTTECGGECVEEHFECAPTVKEDTPTLSRLECAIWMQESGGREGAIMGDGGKSRGPLQCGRAAWKDALQHDPSIGGVYEDVDTIEYAVKVFRAYTDRYCVARRIDGMPYDEAAARMWNGGPTGHRKNATIAYWYSVENFRDDPQLFDIMP